MVTSSALFITDQSSRLLKRLCTHFSHKIQADWDERRGQLNFDIGQASLEASEGSLALHCQAETTAQMHQLQDTLARHLQGMAGLPELSLDWRSA
jgi:hypothetical protein